MYFLKSGTSNTAFPPVEFASPEGLLAVGGDLGVERLLEAYRRGIFPWYSEGQPILWWSPDPRAVLIPDEMKLSHSLRKTLRSGRFRVTFDTRFREVVQACAEPRRQNPTTGTWITAQMVEAYCQLHERGYAHSVEAWHDDQLAGGLYGVALGGAFFGESMFTRVSNASKAAFAALVRDIRGWGFSLIDCQVSSAHLQTLGARDIPRREFLRRLADALRQPDRVGAWHRGDDSTRGAE
jgi:leucyl/phenylalanyl-tRNA---protein transferase